MNAWLKLLLLFVIGFVSVAAMFVVLPPMHPEDVAKLSLPKNLKQVKILTTVLNRYTEQYYWRVVVTIWTLYMFLQTFSVPGTIFLNVLCGALFGLQTGFLMTLLAGTAGASMCYFMSDLFGRPIVLRFSDKLKFLQDQIEQRRNNLFYFMLFLRISPMLPNWFINLASPIVNIPYSIFALATLIGIAPQTFIAVNTGVSLYEISDALAEGSANPLFNARTILTLFGIAFLALLPVLLSNKSKHEKRI